MATRTAILLVLFASALSCVRARTKEERPCTNSSSPTLKFSVTNSNDEAGKWVAHVETNNEEADGLQNSGWKIDIGDNTIDNSGSQPVKQIVAHITAPLPAPRPGYEFFNGLGYYKLHTEGKTWEEAMHVCEREFAHLAIINSEAESRTMSNLLARYPQLGGPHLVAFVGFHDKNVEGLYVTIFDQPLSSTGFARWSTIYNQPDDTPPGEDCGAVDRNGELSDFGCNNKAPFICEQEIHNKGIQVNKHDIDIRIDMDK